MKTRANLKYFVSDCRFNGVYSKDNLRSIKDGTYVINLDDKQNKGTDYVSLLSGSNTAGYFDSFGIEYIPEEV